MLLTALLSSCIPSVVLGSTPARTMGWSCWVIMQSQLLPIWDKDTSTGFTSPKSLNLALFFFFCEFHIFIRKHGITGWHTLMGRKQSWRLILFPSRLFLSSFMMCRLCERERMPRRCPGVSAAVSFCRISFRPAVLSFHGMVYWNPRKIFLFLKYFFEFQIWSTTLPIHRSVGSNTEAQAVENWPYQFVLQFVVEL